MNGCHLSNVSTPSGQNQLQSAVMMNGLSVNYSNTSNSSTRNELQAFISKIRDDATICCSIKQRKTRWLEVRTKRK